MNKDIDFIEKEIEKEIRKALDEDNLADDVDVLIYSSDLRRIIRNSKQEGKK